MNVILSILNDTLRDWQSHYDLFQAVASFFSEKYGFLYFNERPLCQVDADLTIEYCEFDGESIQFFLNRNRRIIVLISWPEDQGPSISSVALVYSLDEPNSYPTIHEEAIQ